jgi:hypothetical protein
MNEGRTGWVRERFLPPLRGVDPLGANRGLTPPANFGQALQANKAPCVSPGYTAKRDQSPGGAVRR